MCGRITLSYADAIKLADELGVPVESLPEEFQPENYRPGVNIAPTNLHPIVTMEAEERVVHTARWGLIPSWAEDAKMAYKTINARVETVDTSPAFRSAFKKHRCLVPVDGFYEWKGAKGDRQPYWFHRPDGSLLYFAGLFESWQPPDKDHRETTFTIITTTANDYMARIHDRMPAILESEDVQDHWLFAPEQDPAKLKPLLAPASEDFLVARPVSKEVNKVQNKEPWLLDEVVLDEPAY